MASMYLLHALKSSLLQLTVVRVEGLVQNTEDFLPALTDVMACGQGLCKNKIDSVYRIL